MDWADFTNRLGDRQITVNVLKAQDRADRTFGDATIGHRGA
jgi:hypothetical protein